MLYNHQNAELLINIQIPLVLVYGLLSSMIWGFADFTGGLASKKNYVFTVTFVSQIFGTFLFIILAIIYGESIPSNYYILLGCISGIFGGIGVTIFYKALAEQKMGIVAPVAAVLTAIVPVIIGAFIEGLPTSVQVIGLVFVIIGIYTVSQEDDVEFGLNKLKLPILSGINFGMFFTFVNFATEDQLYTPLIFARFVSMTVILIGGIFFGRNQFMKINSLGLIILSGLADAGGNIFFALAAKTGRLDIASVLSSLYPASTVVLAFIFLKERMRKIQFFGIMVSLIGIILLTI